MLVRFFRINDPYRLLAILVVMIFISLPLFLDPVPHMLHELKLMLLGESFKGDMKLYSDLITDSAPLAVWFSNGMEAIFGRSLLAWRMMALVILFLQMSFFTIILINNKAHHENTYLPGFIFGLLALFSFDMLSFNSELLASAAILLALNSLFKEIEFRIQRDYIVHNIGFFVGIASLFVGAYWVFMPGILIILIIFTRLDLRKALLYTFGFALPHLLILSAYLLRGETGMIVSDFYKNIFVFNESVSMSATSLTILSAVPFVFFILSLVMLNREARLTKYQSQLLQVMFIWIILCTVVIFFSRDVKAHHFIIFIPPLSYFISHYILLIRRKKLAELTLWAFIISILSILYLTRYQLISSVNYNRIFIAQSKYPQIKDKRVLPLTEDWGVFQQNQLATGFYEWKLSQPIFKELDYFDNVTLINKAIEADSPEIIIDPKNLMPKVLSRIPGLREKYKREGEFYILVKK